MNEITIHCGRLPWHERYFKLFSTGFGAHGISCRRTSEDRPVVDGSTSLLFACNSFKKTAATYRRNHVDFLTVNRCWFGDVNDDVAIGWNGFNGEAYFKWPRDPLPDRYEAIRERVNLGPYPKWRTNYKAPPLVLGDYEQARNLALIKELKTQWKFDKMLWRPHPMNKTDYGIPHVKGSLKAMAQEVGVTLSYSTTAVVEMIVHGVPALTYSKQSIAYGVTGHHPGDIRLFDRTEWLRRLAYGQWHVSEIEDGSFWEHFK